MNFTKLDDGVYGTDGQGYAESDLRAALAAQLGAEPAAQARLSETFFSDTHGFGHDCALHADVAKQLWSPGCLDGGFRPVTIAVVPLDAAVGVERAVAVAAPVAEPASPAQVDEPA